MTIKLPGIEIKVIKSTDDTAGAVAIFEEQTAPGAGPPLHIHQYQTEVFHIRQGRYKLRIEDEIFELQAGDTAVVPAGKPHAFKNIGSETGVLVFELIPGAQAETFFRELAQSKSTNIKKLFKQYGGELVGPSEL